MKSSPFQWTLSLPPSFLWLRIRFGNIVEEKSSDLDNQTLDIHQFERKLFKPRQCGRFANKPFKLCHKLFATVIVIASHGWIWLRFSKTSVLSLAVISTWIYGNRFQFWKKKLTWNDPLKTKANPIKKFSYRHTSSFFIYYNSYPFLSTIIFILFYVL